MLSCCWAVGGAPGGSGGPRPPGPQTLSSWCYNTSSLHFNTYIIFFITNFIYKTSEEAKTDNFWFACFVQVTVQHWKDVKFMVIKAGFIIFYIWKYFIKLIYQLLCLVLVDFSDTSNQSVQYLQESIWMSVCNTSENRQWLICWSPNSVCVCEIHVSSWENLGDLLVFASVKDLHAAENSTTLRIMNKTSLKRLDNLKNAEWVKKKKLLFLLSALSLSLLLFTSWAEVCVRSV